MIDRLSMFVQAEDSVPVGKTERLTVYDAHDYQKVCNINIYKCSHKQVSAIAESLSSLGITYWA